MKILVEITTDSYKSRKEFECDLKKKFPVAGLKIKQYEDKNGNISKIEKVIRKSIDTGIKAGTKVKEYLVDDTINDVKNIFSMDKDSEEDE